MVLIVRDLRTYQCSQRHLWTERKAGMVAVPHDRRDPGDCLGFAAYRRIDRRYVRSGNPAPDRPRLGCFLRLEDRTMASRCILTCSGATWSLPLCTGHSGPEVEMAASRKHRRSANLDRRF